VVVAGGQFDVGVLDDADDAAGGIQHGGCANVVADVCTPSLCGAAPASSKTSSALS
jgi:hypothetical protein